MSFFPTPLIEFPKKFGVHGIRGLVLLFVPQGFWSQLTAFAVFRFFDIVKPPPIGVFDARLRGGFGIMFDDLLAAFYTLLGFACWRALFG